MGLDPIRKFTPNTGKRNGTSRVPYDTIALSGWIMAKHSRIEPARTFILGIFCLVILRNEGSYISIYKILRKGGKRIETCAEAKLFVGWVVLFNPADP